MLPSTVIPTALAPRYTVVLYAFLSFSISLKRLFVSRRPELKLLDALSSRYSNIVNEHEFLAIYGGISHNCISTIQVL